ncbi:LOB domain-containing protein 22 [Senna tora]|uniref:LOB domain-containing protein 22 n=1 Tax=Senna tora TaxID=362788 RepID=A0A834XDC3_9FABA|nr:LOB domain-containing protein 22 [Senna tora]
MKKMEMEEEENDEGECNNPNNQACAACKYRRTKCASDCLLAPYFPHDRQRQFLNAHKLFGVRHITKIIEHLDPHDRDQAMRSIIYQSDMRANDPVGGCYRYIQELQAQIDFHRAELDLVLQQLAIFRSHQLNLNYNNNYHHHQQQQQHLPNYVPHHDQQLAAAYMMAEGGGQSVVEEDVNSSWAAVPQDLSSAMSSLHQNKINCGGGYNLVGDDQLYDARNINNYNINKSSSSSCMLDVQYNNGDARNYELGFEADELVDHHRSDERVLFKIDNAIVKAEAADCIHQQVQDHDLKGAATLFTLTNCTS